MDALELYRKERNTLKFSLITVVGLMIWGLIFNELTDSNIVELDAGAYVISGIIGLLTIYVSRLQQSPRSAAHPLGYSGYIPILNLIRSLMIILICLKGIGESLGSIIGTPPPPDHGIVFVYSGVTMLFNTIGYFYVHRRAVSLNSALLKTDALEWKIDALYNLSILVAFGVAYLFETNGYSSLANYVDPVACILLSVYMSISPARMFKENVDILSISSTDVALKENITTRLIEQVPTLGRQEISFTLINASGVLWLDIEIQAKNGEMEPTAILIEAAEICEKLMSEISPNNKVTYRFKSSILEG